MSDIHDCDGAIKAPGFREALLAYGLAEGQIEAGEGLPEEEDELKYMAAEAIEAGDTEFSLEDTEGERGTTDVRVFAGLYWWWPSTGSGRSLLGGVTRFRGFGQI